jgi:hypothetical protein
MIALPAALSLYAEHIAPAVRQDDLYGNILLPSVICNQKGRLRAIINRRPYFLYRAWALSTPESLIYFKRQEKELLHPLSEAILKNGLKPIREALSALPSSSLSLSAIVEAVFRFLVVSMQDRQALQLAAMLEDSAGLFLRRSSVILCLADPTMERPSVIREWINSIDSATLHDLRALLGGGDPLYRRLPGESAAGEELFYSLFENRSGSAILQALFQDVSRPVMALARRSMQIRTVYVFEALLSSGRLFAAFRLAQALALSHPEDGSEDRIVKSMKEQIMRVALLNDRISLYLRLASDDPQDHERRLRYIAMVYGPYRARCIRQLLQHHGIETGMQPDDAGDVFQKIAEEYRLHNLYDRFEEFLLDKGLHTELRSARRFIASFAGDDFRLRTLLGHFYEDSDPETALRHYDVSLYPSLRCYLALRLRRQLGHPAKKRDLRLRKMLESSSVSGDRGPA